MAVEKTWRCIVCGYVHKGPEPPDVCPICCASASEFEEHDGRIGCSKRMPHVLSDGRATRWGE